MTSIRQISQDLVNSSSRVCSCGLLADLILVRQQDTTCCRGRRRYFLVFILGFRCPCTCIGGVLISIVARVVVACSKTTKVAREVLTTAVTKQLTERLRNSRSLCLHLDDCSPLFIQIYPCSHGLCQIDGWNPSLTSRIPCTSIPHVSISRFFPARHNNRGMAMAAAICLATATTTTTRLFRSTAGNTICYTTHNSMTSTAEWWVFYSKLSSPVFGTSFPFIPLFLRLVACPVLLCVHLLFSILNV